MNSTDLIDLLKTNIEKMNFQQNMCFQMKNWSIAITVAIIGVAWKLDWSNTGYTLEIVSIALHLPLLFFLFFFIKVTRNWMLYFIIFRERTKLLENLLVEKSFVENETITLSEYYKYHTNNSYKEDINIELIKKFFKKDVKDNFYVYLIGITSISFITMIFYAVLN